MRILFLVFSLFILTGSYGQTEDQQRVFRDLLTSNDKIQLDKIESQINGNPDVFIPPVLFAFADFLHKKGEGEKALFWYSLARIRTVVDVQLTREYFRNSAEERMELYSYIFSRNLFESAFSDLSRWGITQKAAVVYALNHEESYDRNWIFSNGNPRTFSEEELLVIMKPEYTYENIKSKTVKEYAVVLDQLFLSEHP